MTTADQIRDVFALLDAAADLRRAGRHAEAIHLVDRGVAMIEDVFRETSRRVRAGEDNPREFACKGGPG